MAANFLEGFAAWLGSVCGTEVTLARDLETPQAGRVYVAPGNCHLTYRGEQMRLIVNGTGHGHVPSGDILFGSLAETAGPRTLGVLLTGMGDDGARGLLAMRRAGAHTIVQDQSSSAVYGMPAAAWALGAATEQLAIGEMADRIIALTCPVSRRTGAHVP
jgi:two-component system chemotaxis response regulator CheB